MRRTKTFMLLGITLIGLVSAHCLAADQAPSSTVVSAPKWSVQVEEVNPGEVNLDPAFRVAIYENLITELGKSKIFEQVYRSGDRKASTQTALLILKINVKNFQAGSETERAVTTVGGATKIKAEYSLQTRDGQTVKDGIVNANVRFFGDNMRVTHNLAHNVASMIKKSSLPDPVKSSESAGE